MQLIADEVEEQGPDAVEDSAVEAAEEKWDPAVTNLETVQAVRLRVCDLPPIFDDFSNFKKSSNMEKKNENNLCSSC